MLKVKTKMKTKKVKEKTECEVCGCKTTHYYDCGLIRAEKIRKINEIKNPWDLPWNSLVIKLEKIL